jgi:hypothetical protein
MVKIIEILTDLPVLALLKIKKMVFGMPSVKILGSPGSR